MRRVILWGEIGIPPVILIGLGLLLFGSTGHDDAYRTYWAAERLAHGGGIVNYNGAHIEQSASLLHTVTLALLHRGSGVELPLVGPLLSLAAGAGTVIAAGALARRLRPGTGTSAALLTGTSICAVYWSVAGLETTLASLCVLLLILAYGRWLDPTCQDRRRLLVGCLAVTAALVLVRPEMPFVLVGMLAGGIAWAAWRRADVIRRLGALLGIAVLAGAAVVGFREVYFHSALPAPARAVHIAPVEGLTYLLHAVYVDENPLTWLEKPYFEHGHKAVIRLPLLIALALGLGAVLRRGRQIGGYGLLAAAFTGVYTAWIVLAGGERMEGGRLVAPVYPVGMAFAAVGVAAAARSTRGQRVILAGLIAAQIVSLVHFARNASTGMPLWAAVEHADDLGAGEFNRFERANRAILRFIPALDPLVEITGRIAASRPGPVVVLSGQMGLPAYTLARAFARRIMLLDRGGLIDPARAGCAARLPDDPDRGCPRPDVIFDLDADTAALERQGYVVMFRERGRVRSGSDLLPGGYVSANVVLAVRIDLLPALGGMRPAEVRFRALQGME